MKQGPGFESSDTSRCLHSDIITHSDKWTTTRQPALDTQQTTHHNLDQDKADVWIINNTRVLIYIHHVVLLALDLVYIQTHTHTSGSSEPL